jgi:hypothetical protein
MNMTREQYIAQANGCDNDAKRRATQALGYALAGDKPQAIYWLRLAEDAARLKKVWLGLVVCAEARGR